MFKLLKFNPINDNFDLQLLKDEANKATTIVIRDNKNNKVINQSGPNKPLWKKREIIRQERTVQYTTVDINGALQVILY